MRPSLHPTDRGKMDAKTIRARRALAVVCDHCLGCGSRCFQLGLFCARDSRCSRRRSPKAPALTPANWVKPRGLWVMPHFVRRIDRSTAHGHGPTREAAMAAFAKTWRRE
jgi:hypothetical protein